MIQRDRKLGHLSPRFRPLAVELVARIAEAGIAVMIVETWRTAEQHAEDLATGHSEIVLSKHQHVDENGMPASDAIDLAPYETYQLHGADKVNWDAGPGPEAVKEPWATMRDIGESLGLRCGARWHKPFDAGHFEYVGAPPVAA